MSTRILLSPAPPLARSTPSRRLLAVASAASLTMATAGAWSLAHPGLNPLAEVDSVLARTILSADGCALLVIALGVLGAFVAVVALASPRRGSLGAPLLAVAVVEVVGAMALQGVTTIALAGYLVAMALPFALGWLVVQVVRRYRMLRWPAVGVVAVVGLWGYWAGTLQLAHIVGLARDLASGFAQHGPQLGFAALVAGTTACWVLVLLRGATGNRPADGLGRWVLRHRRPLTLVAAAGPLPYGLIRATWLTPWPLLVPSTETLSPEIRLWGLLLGGGAVTGSVLTVGLLRSWGVVFPRWVPRWAGRTVPVAAATVPGGLVAGILCVSAVPMLRMTLAPDAGTVFDQLSLLERLAATLVFPFWIWGPALALAVWGYALSRRPGVR